MKKLVFFIILSVLATNTPLWAKSDTLPNNLSKDVDTSEELKKVIDSNDTRFVIVDVRPEAAYERGHIPTAINIPRGFASDIKNPPSKDKYLILYCFNGLTSPAAAERLQGDGYKYIFVWGGVTDWSYELETSK